MARATLNFLHVGPRLSISFVTISLLANIKARRGAICSPVSLGMRLASAASRAAIQSGKLSRWARKRFITACVSLIYFQGILIARFKRHPTLVKLLRVLNDKTWSHYSSFGFSSLLGMRRAISSSGSTASSGRRPNFAIGGLHE